MKITLRIRQRRARRKMPKRAPMTLYAQGTDFHNPQHWSADREGKQLGYLPQKDDAIICFGGGSGPR